MAKLIDKIYIDIFLGKRFFIALGVCIVLFLLSFFFTWLGDLPYLAVGVLILLTIADLILLHNTKRGVFLRRDLPERLSNGDENELHIFIENFYSFPISVGIIDEIPFQFQKRDIWFEADLPSRTHKTITYTLRPVKRGEYDFGQIRVYVCSPLGLMAISNRLNEIGIKKIRRVGHSMEFDQVKNYVQGDDYRTLNWKATARKGELMVNAYTDEKAQHVYCVIDKSRVMKMPFEGLSLLDYAINASLVLSNIALVKEDKAGLITIAEKVGSVVPSDRRPAHLNKMIEVLYKEKTRYLETNMEALYATIRGTLKQRSLVVFFTNFESMSALNRQLPFLKRIARFHLLLIVFFENTELKVLADTPAANVEGIYIKTIAEKFAYEKKLMVKELAKHGILSMLTPPNKLTINIVNRYLAIKAQQKI